MRTITAIIATICILALSASAPAGELHVPDDYNTIQAAIDAAYDGDTVIVADGTYTGEGNRDIFLGKTLTVRSESGPENCIIDCNGSGGNPHRAFYFDSGEGANCIVEGFTLINGLYRDGGLVYCREASPTIDNCILRSSSAKVGGAIYCRDSSPTISNCTITDNKADSGGGVFCRGGSLTMVHCKVTANASEWDGGGIDFSSGSSLTINSSSISYNAAGYEGGAIFCRNGTLRATNCAISGNSADFPGGGVYCHRSNAIITNCTISGNSAPVGGGIHCDEANSTITNSILSGNWPEQIAQEYGGTVSVTYSNVRGGPEGVWRHRYSDRSLDWGPGNIDTDPGFAFKDDYHLMPDSPCIDAGDPNYVPEPNETDIEGTVRVSGDGIDMGAYEYDGSSPLIAISPSLINFSYGVGAPRPEPESLLVRNCGSGTLEWEMFEDCKWLQVAPRHGISSGGIDEVILRVEPGSLPTGLHSCMLRVIARDAANSPVRVTVDIGVGVILHVPEDYPTIQAAIDAAEDYDMVLVADGTYRGEGNRDIDFLGKAVTVKSESGPENCIIDCNGTESQPHRGFYFHSYEDTDSILDGFTIANGHAPKKVISGDWHFYGGGAILCYNSSPAIKNCNIYNCNAREYGGGIDCWGSNPAITKCAISGNTARYDGGGIRCMTSSPTISNCTISGNTASEGGGIDSTYEESGPKIINCTISGNSVRGRGGGINCREGSLTVTNSIVADNSAAEGGGIYSEGSRPMIIDGCTIKGNIAESKVGALGGGIHIVGPCSDYYVLTIQNSNITANTANGYGGGVYTWSNNRSSDFIMKNCKITGNSAISKGGAIYFDSEGYFNITNCTISGNSAADAGGIYTEVDILEPGTASVTNSILCDNFPQQMVEDYDRALVTYSDVQGGWEGHGNIDADPCFVDPGYWADANDPNIIVGPNDPNAIWVEGDYRLLPTSPCIDSGEPNYVAEPNEIDLDGNPRVIDGDEDGTPVVDMGAYEYTPPIPADINIKPKTLNLQSKGRWIICVIRLPEDCSIADIDPNSILLEDEIPADRVWLLNKFAVARFSRPALQELLADLDTPTTVELLISGQLKDRTLFEGTDTIRLIDRPRKRPPTPKPINQAQPTRRLRPHNKSLQKLERQQK
ncbi:MAG: hypothetical protein JSV99_01140 [Planctomycetota bacterium]|nr:MAG: hypothetical protein JSV99_01140 [Planctomycetota bacterium]